MNTVGHHTKKQIDLVDSYGTSGIRVSSFGTRTVLHGVIVFCFFYLKVAASASGQSENELNVLRFILR